MAHPLPTLLFLFLFLQDYPEAKKQFEQAVAALDLEAVRRLAKRLGEIDTGPAAGTLVDGIDAVGRRVEELWAQRGGLEAKESIFRSLEEEIRRYNAQIAQLQKDNKPIPEGLRAQGERLRVRHAEWGKTREELTATEERILLASKTRDTIVDGLSAVKSDAAVRETAKALRGAKAWTTRTCAAQALARIDHPESLPALLSRLQARAESDIGALVAVIDAIRIKAQWGSETLGALASLLEHRAWQVRSAAVRALRASQSLAAVEPLLKAFETSDGRLRDEIHSALVKVTGVDKGFDPADWRTWFEQHQTGIADGSWKPREDERVDGEGRAIGTGVTFFGIPVRSKSIVFVLDRSGSMAEPGAYDAEEERYIETGGTGKPPKELRDLKPAGSRKIDIAKYQLKKVLLTLPAGTRFNIIFYNHRFTAMSDRMMVLGGATRSQAFAFFEPIEPEGETDIWQALGEAMKFCARPGPDGQALEESADTIYLLSDGLPFPPGRVVGPNEIVARFEAWNRARRVVVHTVFVSAMNSGDYTEGHAFMRKFAEENGGSFKAPKQPNQ